MTLKLFVAFVFNLFIRAECYSLYFMVKTLQTYINLTGGNTNRCNFQTPFSLWLCFLLFQKTDNKLIEMPRFRFVSVRSFARKRSVPIKKLAELEKSLHFYNWNDLALSSGRKDLSKVRDKKKGQQSSLKLRPTLVSLQNKHRMEVKHHPPTLKKLEKKSHVKIDYKTHRNVCL